LPEPRHLRRDRRVVVRTMASARRTAPITRAGGTGDLGERARESDTGPVICLVGRGCATGVALGTGEGVMTGKSCVALPASMSVLPTPFRSGIGPSGSAGSGRGYCNFGLRDRAEAEVTAVVAATVGAFHFCVVTMLAVAVSLTDLMEVALDATAICACRTTGRFTETVLTVQAAVPSPLAQPLVKVAF
jgi:hypothetical protein